MDISFLILCASVLCTTIHINSRNVLEPYKSFYSFLPSVYVEQSRAGYTLGYVIPAVALSPATAWWRSHRRLTPFLSKCRTRLS